MTDVIVTTRADQPLVIDTDRATLSIQLTNTGDVLLRVTSKGFGPPSVSMKLPQAAFISAGAALIGREGRWEHKSEFRTIALLASPGALVRLVIGKLGRTTRNQSAWVIQLSPANVTDLCNWIGTIPTPKKPSRSSTEPLCNAGTTFWPDVECIDVRCEKPEGHPDDEGHAGEGFEWED